MTIFAYLRVSTDKQTTESQKAAILEWARRNNVVIDEFVEEPDTSGAIPPLQREKFRQLWGRLKKGDTLVVFELSRLGRSLRDIVLIASELQKRGVRLVSLKENITPENELQYTITIGVLGILAEIERHLISERTKAGMLRAKQEGKRIGATPKVDEQKLLTLLERGLRPAEIADILGVSKSAVYFHIRRLQQLGLLEHRDVWIVKKGES